MGPRMLDGEALAASILDDLCRRVEALVKGGHRPGLGTILTGDDPPSVRYVEMKHEDCAKVGIASFGEHLAPTTTQAELEATISRFNDEKEIDAFLVQLPLPNGLDEDAALLAVDPDKDADGLHPVNLGRLVIGTEGPLPCTPAGIVELLSAYDVPVEGRHVVIVGRGLTIGRPLSLLLSAKRPKCNAAVTILHTGVERDTFVSLVRQADVIVAAAGRPSIITADMVRPGAAVVSAGATFEGRKLLPDADPGVAEVAGFLTPRIGGVGPMTRAMLLRNAVAAAERRYGAA